MPQLYDSAPELLMLKPSEIVMVACRRWDVDHAAGRQFWTAHAARPDEYVAPAAYTPPPAGAYDLQLRSFIELAEVLGA